jgi:acyl-coenzyme A synthetase/AMP-(fatty) acid ligase
MVVVVPDALLRFPASTSELIERERVTVWYSVPYILRQLVERGALDQRDLSSLRWILFGGEVYPPGELAALMAAIPSVRVSNVYGPAEVNQCTYFHLDEPPAADDPVPIGRAWPETELLIVGEDREPVPDGAPGELLVATTTMMAGYWKRPDLTAASIDERDGRRWYRTGDLVRRRSDGELEFLGRADNQVKIRGQRVELEAVDAVLLDTPGVREGGVVIDRSGTDHELVAGVVVEPGADATSIARAMSARLPGAAVPTTIVALDSIPRSPNGKIDRSALVTELTMGRTAGEPPGASTETRAP